MRTNSETGGGFNWKKKCSEFGKNSLDLRENTGTRIKQDSVAYYVWAAETCKWITRDFRLSQHHLGAVDSSRDNERHWNVQTLLLCKEIIYGINELTTLMIL